MLIERTESSTGRLCHRRRCCRGEHMLYRRLLLPPRRSRRAAIWAPREADMTGPSSQEAYLDVYNVLVRSSKLLHPRIQGEPNTSLTNCCWQLLMSPETQCFSRNLAARARFESVVTFISSDWSDKSLEVYALTPGFLPRCSTREAKSKGSDSRPHKTQ